MLHCIIPSDFSLAIYSSTCAAAPSKTAMPPMSVPCWACVGSAIFVLDDVGCDVDGVWELAVVTGANVDTAAVEEAAEQLSQP